MDDNPSSKSMPQRRLCHQFLSGKCTYGERCKFLHQRENVNNSGGTQSVTSARQPPNNGKKGKKGPANDNNHPKAITTPSASTPHVLLPPVPSTSSNPLTPTIFKKPCFAWIRTGKCNQGANCRYSHDIARPYTVSGGGGARVTSGVSNVDREKEASKNTQSPVFGNASDNNNNRRRAGKNVPVKVTSPNKAKEESNAKKTGASGNNGGGGNRVARRTNAAGGGNVNSKLGSGPNEAGVGDVNSKNNNNNDSSTRGDDDGRGRGGDRGFHFMVASTIGLGGGDDVSVGGPLLSSSVPVNDTSPNRTEEALNSKKTDGNTVAGVSENNESRERKLLPRTRAGKSVAARNAKSNLDSKPPREADANEHNHDDDDDGAPSTASNHHEAPATSPPPPPPASITVRLPSTQNSTTTPSQIQANGYLNELDSVSALDALRDVVVAASPSVTSRNNRHGLRGGNRGRQVGRKGVGPGARGVSKSGMDKGKGRMVEEEPDADEEWLKAEESRLMEVNRLVQEMRLEKERRVEERRLEEERRIEEERRRIAYEAAEALRLQAAAEEARRQRQLEAEERERARLAEVEAKRREAVRRAEEAAAARRAQLAEQERVRHEQEARVTTQHIVLGSTLITCGSGLEVRGVVSGFESCRVTIRDLPADAKPHEIVELFTQQGVSADNVHVASIARGRAGAGGGDAVHLEARVLTSAAEGGAIAAGLDGIEFRDESLTFEVSDIVSDQSMGESSSKQADTLTITFPAPSLSVVATYGTMEEARNKARSLNGRTIPGAGARKIKAEMNQRPANLAYSHYTYVPESVKITRIPTSVTFDTIYEFAETLNVRPIKSNSYDLDVLLESLRTHFSNIADTPLREFTVSRERDVVGIVTIKAHFDSWEHANRANEYIQARSSVIMYRGPPFQFSLPRPHHFVMTIPVQQYEAQKSRWDELSDVKVKAGSSNDTSQKGAPRIHISRVPDRGIVRLNLSGDDKKAVGTLKVRLETLAAGEKLDATCWHRSFLWQKGKDLFGRVLRETGVYVRADFKAQALKIYGVGDARQTARQMIEDEVTSLEQQEWTVMLKRQSVGYFVQKGLKTLKEVLGEDAVTLDLTSTPCRLTLRGGEEARHTLDTLMTQSFDNLHVGISNPDTDVICPICYDGVSNPVTLACKHSYCRACLRHYLTSATDTKIFPLACMGDESACKKPIPIPIIKQFLTSQQYEHLVSVVFSTYLDQHPQEFKYCTTPDCPQIYRANTKMMLKCPSCYAEVCSSCHEEAHEGMTCQERRFRKAEQEQLDGNWAASMGMKQCPSCKAYIEKNGGCNHMKCHCGAHICWICNQVFPTDSATYAHLTERHGGYFDHDRVAQNNNDDARIAAELQRQENARVAGHIGFGAHLPAANQQRNAVQAGGVPEAAVQQDALRRLQARAEYQRQVDAHRAREARDAQAAALRREAQLALQRRVDQQQERITREAEQRRRREDGWGCTIM